jgi:5-oxoprolinase (ATP-hydrolysing)
VLGRIDAAHFPVALDIEAARTRIEVVAAEAGLEAHDVARGFLRIAVEAMAHSIRKISIRRGHDVTRYTLACFGGAGGQHACAVADALGIERILIHPLAGVLSAHGIGLAPVTAIREASWLRPVDEDYGDGLDTLEASARGALIAQGITTIEVDRRARLRLPGSDTTIELALQPAATLAARFAEEHRKRFGYDDDSPPVLDTLIVEARSEHDRGARETLPGARFPCPPRSP